MLLFKAAGSTYLRVVRQSRHAFPYRPVEVRRHEFILLSKNREDCTRTEPQIQYVAKLLDVRPATPQELEREFSGVNAGERWKYLAKLYWSWRLDRPVNLSQVHGLNYRRYDTVQDFARFDEADESLLLEHLVRTNGEIIVDVISRAEPPADDDWWTPDPHIRAERGASVQHELWTLRETLRSLAHRLGHQESLLADIQARLEPDVAAVRLHDRAV